MELLMDLTIIFAVAAVMLLIMDKYNHPSVPGYIIAGLVAGSFISSMDLLNLVQIGIAFLIFIFGLKYSPKNLNFSKSATLSTSIIQIFLTGLVGFTAGSLLGFSTTESFYFAIAASLSSSLVGLQLTEKEINTDLLHGRLSQSIHFVQDIIAFILIAIVLSITIESVIYTLLYSALLILLAIGIREYVFTKIAEQAGGDQELLTMTALTFLISFIGLSEILGISMVIGAFAAGIAASKFPYNVELLDTMGSIKDFFSAIFLVVLGALVTFPTQTVLVTASTLTLITLIVSPLTTYYSLKLFGYDNRTALLTSLSLDQVSELALVIAIQGFIIGLISSVLFEAIILSATATMILSSYTKKYEENIYQRLTSKRSERKSYEIENHIVVVGYDVQGKKIVKTLEKEKEEFIVIDNDPEKISELQEKGIKAIYGDVMDDITWKEVKSKKAKLIISTVPSEKVSEKINSLDSEADKIVRAETPERAREFIEENALHAIIPDFAAAEELEEQIRSIVRDPEKRKQIREQNFQEFKEHFNE